MGCYGEASFSARYPGITNKRCSTPATDDFDATSYSLAAKKILHPRASQIERLTADTVKRTSYTGSVQNWFLDYASVRYLERAVPHLDDGAEACQRRILHAIETP